MIVPMRLARRPTGRLGGRRRRPRAPIWDGAPHVELGTGLPEAYARFVAPRRDEPKVLDTGRVTLVMRARKTDGTRFPFLRTNGHRHLALALAAALALAGLGVLLLATR